MRKSTVFRNFYFRNFKYINFYDYILSQKVEKGFYTGSTQDMYEMSLKESNYVLLSFGL